ncbi:MAG: helix-turn-helix transcriptional regulator [Thermoguttaceae bacterium]|jgi:transcriptional regulator with XRE-family HTH domain
MPDHTGKNLLRLMAAGELSLHQVAQRTHLDERTVRGIARGTHQPHARTLHRLAEGMGVAVDEFFVDPAQLLYRRFDRRTNPVVEEVLQDQPELFEGWGEADFDELHSRVGTGGPLTPTGAMAAIEAINRRRDLHEKLDLLLESSLSGTVSGMLDLMHQQVVVEPESGPDAAAVVESHDRVGRAQRAPPFSTDDGRRTTERGASVRRPSSVLRRGSGGAR